VRYASSRGTLAEGRRGADNRRVLATRLTMTLARGMFFVFASFGLLLGGGIILVPRRPGSARQQRSSYTGWHICSRIYSVLVQVGTRNLLRSPILRMQVRCGGMIHDMRLKAVPPQPAERQSTTSPTQHPAE
jgi:hypothetical protein